MFERFTAAARQSVVNAQLEARRLHHPRIGTEHLLLALTLGPESDPARVVLGEFGLDHEATEAQLLHITGTGRLDAEALSSVGIDLDEIRRRVEAEFGPGALDEVDPLRSSRRPGLFGLGGHIPFGNDAKDALELALREAIELGHRELGSAHILLGVLRSSGLAIRVVDASGVSTGLLRSRLALRMRTSA